jgi:SAM-dependent methyltransferase
MPGMTEEPTGDDPTVERFDPQAHPDTIMAAEHLVRYRWARQFARGRRILDAGSGTGFGSAMLAEAGAEHVVGIDNDTSAVEQASADRPHNVEFAVCDVAGLPFDDASFDIVTCMEVIEHVDNPARVIDELHRVLKPDGLLLLSTPNREVVVPGNPFHLHEFTPDELVETISRRFRNVAARRQHTWVATGVMDDATLSRGSGSIQGAELHRLDAGLTGEEPTTVVAASDGEIPADRVVIEICEPVDLRAIDRTFHEQRQLIDDQQRVIDDQQRAIDDQQRVIDDQQRVTDDHQRVIDDQQRVIDDQTHHGNDLRSELAKLRTALVDAETQLARMTELESELQETRAVAEQLRDVERQNEHVKSQNEELKMLMDSLLNSTSWRVTSPMRKLMAFFRSKIGAR